MKFRLPLPLCIAICAVLVLGGLVYGSVGGLTDSRARVEALLTADGGLEETLFNRGCDARNLLVIAGRYLPEDGDAAALREAADVLQSAAPIEEKRAADARLTEAAQALAERVRAAEGFPSRPDDENNLRIVLERDLGLKDSSSAAAKDYNTAAQGFNARLAEPVNGFLPRLLGVKPCPLYE